MEDNFFRGVMWALVLCLPFWLLFVTLILYVV